MHGSLSKLDAQNKTQIAASDIPHLLDDYGDSIKILSLDCFDTLLWRKTATPRDVFAVLADQPAAKRLGVTPYQRMNAAARAYRAKFVETGSRQIGIGDVYRSFTSLSAEEQAQLAEAEIQTEMDVCFAFPPCVDLMRQAHARGIEIIIVSDMYLREGELRRLLTRHLPADVMQTISRIYCSVDYGTAKGEGLFPIVIRECDVPASQILHIGDNEASDAQAPRKLGVRALHFLQFDREVANFLRLQHAASSLTVLGQVAPEAVIMPRYSPFRPVYSVAELQPYAPETTIGYMSFGPVLYAYARFLMDEVEALRQQGKRVKVFFLLRDAYLLSRACEAYARKPVGKLVRLRKFAAVAASFKTRADVDYYISGIKPEYYNFHVIAEQLLLPPELTEVLLRVAHQSADPQAAFHKLLHDNDVLQLIFKNSAAYRERLKRYMAKEMQLEEGDTIVLADTGYTGVTQDYLTRAFADELKVEILGRYVLGSHEPDRPSNSKSLITTSWCDHSLFEQSCTLKEAAVIDYDLEGEPVFEETRLSDEQYAKVTNIQAECLRFIHDANTFFAAAGVRHDYSILQRAAHAALFRHVYMPVEAELEYFKNFQHDKDMGPDRKKTIYDLKAALKNVRSQPSPYRLSTYETRGLGLDFAFSALVQRAFQLDLLPEDMNARFSPLKIWVGRAQESKVYLLRAEHTHDGYFSMMLPFASGIGIKMFFGEHYEWLQIEKIQLLNRAGLRGDLSNSLDLEDINREGEIYRCLSQASVATIQPVDLQQAANPHYCHIVFRPLVLRARAA
jgi:FMN phosphatase YigB (HAD superfamily)